MRLLNTKQTCEKLGGVSQSSFYKKYRTDPQFPKPIRDKQGCVCGYRDDELDAYIQSLSDMRV
jgi:predicted DNA-binding transcriptional regulator AlpA